MAKPLENTVHLNDIVDVYDDQLSEEHRLILKMGSASTVTGRKALEPGLTEALRSLRSASVQEAKDNEYYMKGEMPPRFQGLH